MATPADLGWAQCEAATTRRPPEVPLQSHDNRDQESESGAAWPSRRLWFLSENLVPDIVNFPRA
jgi:hypothetical protein